VESARGTAEHAVQALRDGDFDLYNSYLDELERLLQWRKDEVRKHLLDAGIHVAYLEQAQAAAQEGNEQRVRTCLLKAVAYVGESEVAVLVEEYRLSFSVQQPEQELSHQTRCGFVR
jgi:hypothetical protein